MTPLRYLPSTPSAVFPTGEDVIDTPGDAIAHRVWIPSANVLVLGNSQRPDIELNVTNVIADEVPVYQRKGGGGAVLLGPGCVCLAIRFPKRGDWGIHDYFAAGNGLLAQAVAAVSGLRAVPRGISDLAVDVTDGMTEGGPDGFRKISGSSLYMPRTGVLYLASLLVAAPIEDWDRYLRHPSREPDYRAGRGHRAFVANVAELARKGVLRDGSAGGASLRDVTPEAVKTALEDVVTRYSRP